MALRLSNCNSIGGFGFGAFNFGFAGALHSYRRLGFGGGREGSKRPASVVSAPEAIGGEVDAAGAIISPGPRPSAAGREKSACSRPLLRPLGSGE